MCRSVLLISAVFCHLSVHGVPIIWGIEGGIFIPLIQIEYLLGGRQSLSPGNSSMSKKVTPLKDDNTAWQGSGWSMDRL